MSEVTATGPKGLGGWLLFVILGLLITPPRIAYFLAINHWPIFREGVWAQLTTPGEPAYHALWAPVLIFEIIGNVGSIVLAVATLVVLFKRSKYTPRLAIAWLAWTSSAVIIDFIVIDFIPVVAAQTDPQSVRDLVRSIFSAAIWIPYFLVSRRVAATFVE